MVHSIGEQLRRRRAGGNKSNAYNRLGVSPTTYNAWESGMYVPGDEHAAALADYLGVDLRDMVWQLYIERTVRADGLQLTLPA